jgi:hypothetical protein
MKKLFKYSNPFVLLLIPVMFALMLGVAYQFDQKPAAIKGTTMHAKQATSLFYKGVSLFKTVAGVSKEKVW